MTKKKETYEPDLADLTPRPRIQGPGPSSRALDSLHERGILGAEDTPSASSVRPAQQQHLASFGPGVGSPAGRTRNRYEPDLEDLTPKPREQGVGLSSSAVEALQQRGMWSDADRPPPPSAKPASLPVPAPPNVNLRKNTYEPDLEPKPRTQESGPSSRAIEALQQRGMWSDEDTPPTRSVRPALPPLAAAPPSVNLGSGVSDAAGRKRAAYEPDLEPRPRIQEAGLSSSAVDGLRRRGMLGDENESAPKPKALSSPHISTSAVSAANSSSSGTNRKKEPYIPSFDHLPGAHGPPGPTPTAIEGLKKRGIWVEEDDGTLSPPPRRQVPEPTGLAPAAIAALKQRGMWQEDVVPATDSNAPARPTPAATSSSYRPSQAEVLASQHPIAPPPPESKRGAKPETLHRYSSLEEPDGEIPTVKPSTPPVAAPRKAARRATKPRQRAKPSVARVPLSDPGTEAAQSKIDLRVQRTIKIPRRCNAHLAKMAERRGVSINAVILGLLADACAAARLGNAPEAQEREADSRVRRTIRIPGRDYDQLSSMAQERDVGINTVILDVLTQA